MVEETSRQRGIRPSSREDLIELLEEKGWQGVDHPLGSPVWGEQFLPREEMGTIQQYLDRGKSIFVKGGV